MSKRLKYSRWRRLPKVYRSGEYHMPDNSRDEAQRLTLYLPGELLDAAEAQAERAGAGTVQDYCAELLMRAIENQRIQEQVADVEARRGPLEGLQEIANDAQYLAEWNALSGGAAAAADPGPQPTRFKLVEHPLRPGGPRPAFGAPAESPDETGKPTDPKANPPETAPEEGGTTPMPQQLAAHSTTGTTAAPESPATAGRPAALSASAVIVLRHAGHTAIEDPLAFLPSLRRGEAVPTTEVAELTAALTALEAEYRDAPSIDRRLAYALHRLALEAQVLHTDAWAGSFDAWTVNVIRNVQEAVERILSGQDIHYYPIDAAPETLS